MLCRLAALPRILLSSSVSLAVFGLSITVALADQATWDNKIFDPKGATKSGPGLPSDFELPMPCGGKMVFRPVEVAPNTRGSKAKGNSFLANRAISVGKPMDVDAQKDPNGIGYSIYRYETNLAGSFSQKDADAPPVYYIGKYEVTDDQYAAVMNGGENCLTPKVKAFPKTSVSFPDAQKFTQLWTTWLYQHAKDSLPVRGGLSGFVRLPTDAEWSFAADGGGKNTDGGPWPQKNTPCAAEPAQCIVGSAESRQTPNGAMTKMIGTGNPNPLGIYDIVGNAEEFILDPFQLNAVWSRQGMAGGNQTRGGGVNNTATDMDSATRHEMPVLNGNGEPAKDQAVGFRVVIGAVALGKNQPALARKAFIDLVSQTENQDAEVKRHNEKATQAVDSLGQLTKTSDESQKEQAALQKQLADLRQASQQKEAELKAKIAVAQQGQQLSDTLQKELADLQAQKSNEEKALEEKLLQDQAKSQQDQAELKARVEEAKKALAQAQEAQNEANAKKAQADLNHVVSDLVTLVTLSKQIAVSNGNIEQDQAFVNDPANASNQILETLRKGIQANQTSLDEATGMYRDIIKVSADATYQQYLKEAESMAITKFKGLDSGDRLTRRLRWLSIALENAHKEINGGTLDTVKDIIEPIEKSVNLS